MRTESLGLIYFFIYYFLAGLAVNLGYHRVLSHRSLKLRKWFERTVVSLGLPAGTPIQWAGSHRFHHANTETPEDPHSPHHRGFWYSHVGWYIPTERVWICILYSLAGPIRTLYDGWNRPRTNQQFNSLAKDVARDFYYSWISRPIPYLVACWLHVAIFFGVATFLMGWPGIGIAWLSSILIYNLGDSIDSWAHIVGEHPFQATHKAGNHWLLGLLILGEGWHANHHTFPESARHGLLPGQWDWTWGVIRVLRLLRIAYDIHVPTDQTVSAKLRFQIEPASRVRL